MKDPHKHPLYRAGHSARLDGKSRAACPFSTGEMFNYALWLAGWGDADMEAA